VYVQEVCPGRGSLDYETYLVRMSRLEWPRALNPEHFPREQFPEAYAYFRKVAAKVGVKFVG
jgi:sugar phosphate isomerase/epimerase